MKRVVIITNLHKDNGISVTSSVAARLLSVGITPYCALDDARLPDGVLTYSAFPADAEAILVVGGDGSVIDASALAIEYGIPLIAVNLGKVGYLAEIEPSDLSPLDRLANDEYSIEHKMLLTVRKDGVSLEPLAVNDVVISHGGHLGIAQIRVSDSHGNTLGYRSDGVIISTPQGSTAYSLSAGGPILSHRVDGLVLSPVCPHSFFNRSVIFAADEHLGVTNVGEGELNISIDGRCTATLASGESCEVLVAEKTFDMITLSENSMFRNLFKKMRILEDID